MRFTLVAFAALLVPLSAVAGPQVLLGAADSEIELAEAEAALKARGFEPVFAEAELAKELKSLQKRDERLRSKIEKKLKAADAAFLEQRWKVTFKHLNSAESSALALSEPESMLGDIAFKRGVAYTAQGGSKRARRAFALALAIDPKRRPPRGLYGPDVSREFAVALAERQNQVKRRIDVSVSPKNASVVIDGRALRGGKARLRGRFHVVRVFAPGYRAKTLIVRGGKLARVKLKRDSRAFRVRAAAAMWRGQWRANRGEGRELILALAADLGIRSSIWVQEDPVKAQLIAKNTSSSAGGSDVSSAVAKVASNIGPGGEAKAGSVVAKTDQDEGGSIVGKWWFWASIAGGTAAVVTTALILSGGDSMPGGGGPGPTPAPGSINIGIVDP